MSDSEEEVTRAPRFGELTIREQSSTDEDNTPDPEERLHDLLVLKADQELYEREGPPNEFQFYRDGVLEEMFMCDEDIHMMYRRAHNTTGISKLKHTEDRDGIILKPMPRHNAGWVKAHIANSKDSVTLTVSSTPPLGKNADEIKASLDSPLHHLSVQVYIDSNSEIKLIVQSKEGRFLLDGEGKSMKLPPPIY